MQTRRQATGGWRAMLAAGLLLAACQPSVVTITGSTSPWLSAVGAPVSTSGISVSTTVRLGRFGTAARQALRSDIQRIDVRLRERTALGPPVVWTPVGSTLSVDRNTQPGSAFGAALTVRFPLVPNGTYSLSAEAFDAGSVSLNQAGPAISNTFGVNANASPPVAPAPALSLALRNATGETISGNTISFTNGTPWAGPAAGWGYAIEKRYGIFQTIGDLDNHFGRMARIDSGLYVAAASRHVIIGVDVPNGNFDVKIGRRDDPGHTVNADPGLCRLDEPKGIGVAGNGDLYFTTAKGTAILRMQSGNVEQLAGSNPYSNLNDGDGGLATAANVLVDDLAVTTAGTVYVCSRRDGIVRRFAAGGAITTVAGGGGDDPGNGGHADQAVLREPSLVAADGNQWLYILEQGRRLRRLNLAQATPTIDEIGEWAELDQAAAMTVGPDRQVYFACADRIVRAINPLLRKITTVAGDGTDGLPGDGDEAGKPLGLVSGLAFDKHGALLLLPQAQPTLLRLNW
jgi:hypothetical protein